MKHSVFLLLLGASIAVLVLPSTVRADDDAAKIVESTEEISPSKKGLCAVAMHFNLSLLAHLLSIFWIGSTAMAPAIQELLLRECVSKKDGRVDHALASQMVDDTLSGDKNGIWCNMVDKLAGCPNIGRELGDVVKSNFGGEVTDNKILEKINTIRHIRGVIGPAKGCMGLILQLICGPAVYPPQPSMGPSVAPPSHGFQPAEPYP